MSTTVLIHERRAHWARQLRPRLADKHAVWVETRTQADLRARLEGIGSAICVLDGSHRVLEMLDDLEAITRAAPDVLSLALGSTYDQAFVTLARELGATHVMPSAAHPPEVAEVVGRWIDLAARRNEGVGWKQAAFHDRQKEWWEQYAFDSM